MTHEGWEIHCGTAGTDQGERTIKIYQGSAMDFAVALKPEGLAAFGMTPKQIERAKRKLDHFYYEFTEWLEEHGVPYTRHDPHPENLPEHEA